MHVFKCISGRGHAYSCSFLEASYSPSTVAVAYLLLTGRCLYVEAKDFGMLGASFSSGSRVARLPWTCLSLSELSSPF